MVLIILALLTQKPPHSTGNWARKLRLPVLVRHPIYYNNYNLAAYAFDLKPSAWSIIGFSDHRNFS
ncbi:hypothetical protein PL78_14375 [Yersinia entomophaga]|uniref:Uncharacterized protein n=1 Tax=Yersinia entomophaga TaxID=935293 RepID=A0ABN4Q162_YERET|nr:hypothetical protein PL78_14375 [Yersinia entomophaga]OWF88651.1 hypothetical protein B4914_06795 [Yersinia entomophaga]